MKSLLEAGTILGGKGTALPEMTTKLIEPQPDEDDPSASRIPNKYHIVKSFPIFPKDFADQGYRVYNKDGMWNVVIWPSSNPDTRQDVQYLSDALRLMLDELHGDTVSKSDLESVQDVQKAKAQASNLIKLYEKRVSLLKVAFDELTRQVSKHCAERGSLLSFITSDLFEAFHEIPLQYNACLRLMKKENDQLKVSLDAKTMELESQAKDLNESISLMSLERKMEKEWHTQLEDQVKKWKVQVENYKKKAQDQIKLEREMLEQQISGLRDVVSNLRLENDALKEQLQFQRNELAKSEKKIVDVEDQLQIANKKNEKLQLQLSKGGQAAIASRTSEAQGIEKDFVEGSKLRQLLSEFPQQRQIQLISQKEITQTVFGLFDYAFSSQLNSPFDDFYAQRLLMTEESPQSAADTARSFIGSLQHSQDAFCLANIAIDFLKRKYSESVVKILINFYGFFKAQPFQCALMVDASTDIPSFPLSVAWMLVTTMFTPVLGESSVREVNDGLKQVAVEERGQQPMIPFVTVFDACLKKCYEFFSKKYSDMQRGFVQTYTRYQRTILLKTPNADPNVPRMDWRTFRDFMKPYRPELCPSDFEWMFMNSTQFSDSIASVTIDAFETMCVSKQIYVNNVPPPGSGRRLRYVPPDMLSVIESAWKGSLRAAVKRAITELSKSDQSQASVQTLRGLDQKLEDNLKNSAAGPFCVQLLHEAATVIGSEAVTIASSLPIEKCLSIMENQLKILNTDEGK